MMTNGPAKTGHQTSLILLVLTALNCLFQIAWFWRFRGHNITMDGVNYIGLARHLLDGDFTASLHGYWSPLLSWMIAAGSLFTHDFTVLARVITIASFLLCFPLLYALTFKLWHSHLAASLAVFWFSMARGVVAGALITIQADFLLVACSLAYFLLLLACLRQGTNVNWFFLGLVHAIAFLTKAIAMPWLSLTTLVAVLAANRKSLRSATAALLLAFLAPAIIWLSWGETLKTKYGVFTTGYQLQANLMVGLKRKLSHHLRGDPYAFVDTSYDKYMVAETPFSTLQQFKVMNPALVPVIFGNELRNLPAAVKEIVILLTPGGVLTFVVGLIILTRKYSSYFSEALFAWISIFSMATLVGAYCMLVFDARYVLPVVPILMAVASRFFIANGYGADDLDAPSILRKTSLGLLLASMIFFTCYWASPFRTENRDFQVSCYQAADLLKASQLSNGSLVSIGEGPYPEHGIGFEVGTYVAYLSGWHLAAMNSALPNGQEADKLEQAILEKKPDAVLIWGKPGDRNYQMIVDRLRSSPGVSLDKAILDPTLGDVGRIVFFR